MKTLLLIFVILAPLWLFGQAVPNPFPPGRPAGGMADKYAVFVDPTADGLVKKVSQAMSEGWEPAGGVSATVNGGGHFFCQAMTKQGGRFLPR